MKKQTLAATALGALFLAAVSGFVGYMVKEHQVLMERVSWYHHAFEGNYALINDELTQLKFRGFCISLAVEEQEPGVIKNLFRLIDDYKATATRHNRIATIYNATVGGIDYHAHRQMPQFWEPIPRGDLSYALNAAMFQGKVDLREECRKRFNL